MATCLSVVGLVIQVAVLVTAAVSHLTPFWVQTPSNHTAGIAKPEFHAGLWMNCTEQDCVWAKVDWIPYWFSAVRIVLACAVANSIVALFIAMSYLCCSCCRYAIKALQFNILVLVIGCAETVGAIAAYVVKYKELYMFDVDLSWSFYVACASGICFILAIIFTVCETSNARRRNNYEPIRPTNMS